jgi:hypothetical protein
MLKRIKPIIFFGIVLIIVGVAVFAYEGITYPTRENVVDLSSNQANVETQKNIGLPPILGAMVLASGIVLVVAGTKNSWMS